MTRPAPPNVRFRLANRPENVALVRELLAGVAEAVTLADGQLDDIKTVVSEAANNVVLHAYDGAEGPLEVEVSIADERIEIVVRDQGSGIRPRPASDQHISGIGLAVIAALTDRAEFRGGVDDGTEVRMEFVVPSARRPVGRGGGEYDHLPLTERDGAADGVDADFLVAPVELAQRLLSRPLTALAARARFSIDRLADVQMVIDAVAAGARAAVAAGPLEVRVALDTHRLELRVGPLAAGEARELVRSSSVGGVAPLLETLCDGVAIAAAGEAEMLTLLLLDHREIGCGA